MRADSWRRVVVAITVITSLFAFGAAKALAAGSQKPIVVIVPGLQMNAAGGGNDCGAQGALQALCQAYQDQGYDVYIPPTSTTGANGAVINTGGDVATNAAALANYVGAIESANPGANVSAVGYSMGGLMVVDAIRDNGMAVNSVVTIGSPLDGSYLADTLTTVANMDCGPFDDGGCALDVAAAQLTINSIGAGAIYSLTTADRTAENAGQGPIGVPMTTIVGNGCGTSLGDCVVSVSSQLGTNSNLGPTSSATDPDVHTEGPFGILTKLCLGCSTELSDPTVISTAVKASQSGCSSSAYCIPQIQQLSGDLALPKVRRLTTRDPRSTSAPRNVHLTLNAPTFITLAAGASQTITGANVIESTSPFAAGCVGAALASPSASTPIYITSASNLDCATNQVTIQNQGSDAITLGVLSNSANVRAKVGGQGAPTVPITVKANAEIKSVTVATQSGKVLHKVRGGGRRTVTFLVSRAQASQQLLSVTLKGQPAPYTTAIPLLPAAKIKPTLVVTPRSVKSGQTVTIIGAGWATGTVNLTLMANGSTHYVLATLSANATAAKGFTLTWTAPSGIDARTPVRIIASGPQRAPATAKFTITRSRS